MKKTIALILCLTLLSLCFMACDKEKIKIPEKVTYYDNLSVVGLAINAEEELTGAPIFVDVSADVLESAGGIRLDLCKAYVSKKATSERLDEYGIFQCKDGASIDALYTSVKNYVNNRKEDSVTLSHFADADTVKNGVVMCYGNYVVYTFLAGNGNSAFQSMVEDLLQK